MGENFTRRIVGLNLERDAAALPNDFQMQDISGIPNIANLNDTPNARENVNRLWDSLNRLGTAVYNNKKSIYKYKRTVKEGLISIKNKIIELSDLINALSQRLRELMAAPPAGPVDENRIARLEQTIQTLLLIINQANTAVSGLLTPDGNLKETDLDTTVTIQNIETLLQDLQNGIDRATRALAEGEVNQEGIDVNRNPLIDEDAIARRGGKKKTKRHQKNSKKTNKKKSKKTAKRGKKMRGGYSYGKSKRRHRKSRTSSSLPSSLSSSSKNIIAF
jgi:predicted  nucleic acid-binding Zn-ribbon protein